MNKVDTFVTTDDSPPKKRGHFLCKGKFLITVYTKPHCSQCQIVKVALNNANIKFEEKLINDWALSVARKNGWTSAPIVIDDHHTELSFAGLNHRALEKLIEAH